MKTIDDHVKNIYPGLQVVNIVVKDLLVNSESELQEFKRAWPIFIQALQGELDPMYPSRAHVSVLKTKVLIHFNGTILIFGIKTLKQLKLVHETLLERYKEANEGVCFDDELNLF